LNLQGFLVYIADVRYLHQADVYRCKHTGTGSQKHRACEVIIVNLIPVKTGSDSHVVLVPHGCFSSADRCRHIALQNQAGMTESCTGI